MGFRVVCISRTIAAGGEAIGQAVAQRLGFRYVDEEIIERAAHLAQVDPAVVARAEDRQPLLQRLLSKLTPAHEMAAAMTLAIGVPLEAFIATPGTRAMADDLRLLIRAAIEEVAAAGNAVIVAHAASVALSGNAAVLRVLVTASPDERARRLTTSEGIGAAEATKAVAASDRARHDYFAQFYGLTEEQPTHYDLVLNTDVLTTEQAAAIIAAGVRSTDS